jgi:hypothetical protein
MKAQRRSEDIIIVIIILLLGFRAGRSTSDHVFCLKQLIEKKMSLYQPLHLLFVDLEKAYDRVPLINVWKALEHYNISNSIIRAIKRL